MFRCSRCPDIKRYIVLQNFPELLMHESAADNAVMKHIIDLNPTGNHISLLSCLNWTGGSGLYHELFQPWGQLVECESVETCETPRSFGPKSSSRGEIVMKQRRRLSPRLNSLVLGIVVTGLMELFVWFSPSLSSPTLQWQSAVCVCVWDQLQVPVIPDKRC